MSYTDHDKTRTGRTEPSGGVGRTAHASPSPIQDMGVDHRGIVLLREFEEHLTVSVIDEYLLIRQAPIHAVILNRREF